MRSTFYSLHLNEQNVKISFYFVYFSLGKKYFNAVLNHIRDTNSLQSFEYKLKFYRQLTNAR